MKQADLLIIRITTIVGFDPKGAGSTPDRRTGHQYSAAQGVWIDPCGHQATQSIS